MSSETGPRTSKIIVGVDGSPSSQQALRWAARQARLTGDDLQVVTAWSYPGFAGWSPLLQDTDWTKNAQEILDQAIANTLDETDGYHIERTVTQGHPARVLLDLATDADLIVVGSRGHGGFAGMLLGSISQHVAAHATCPVVVVHGPDHTPPGECVTVF